MSDWYPPDGRDEQSYGRSYGEAPPPPGGRPKPQQTSNLALAGLVTGIIGVIPCCWGVGVVSVAAVVLGVLGRKQVRESAGALGGDGLALAAIVLGAVGVLATIVYWGLIITGVVDLTFDFEGSLTGAPIARS